MSYDLLTGKSSPRDWSCGASDLPSKAKGYAPERWWGPSQMEDKLKDLMSKSKGLFGFGGKPSRSEAVDMLVDYMKSNKIGPRDVSSGVGSILLPAKEQARLMSKLDDVRYDIRGARDTVGAGVFALAGAVAALAFAKIYKAARD